MNEFDNIEYGFISSNQDVKERIPTQLGNQNFVRPKFNTLIENGTENKTDSSEKKFNGPVIANLNKDTTPYGFNTVVDQLDNIPKPEMVEELSMDKLVEDKPIKFTKSLGLDLNPLIKNIPINKNDPEFIGLNFNNLISDFVPNYDNKFGVQAIPLNMDTSMLPKPITPEDLHNNKDNKPNRKINNWFTRIIDQKGEDYFTSGKLTIEEVSKNAERIIDDMIAGKVDYDKFGPYLILPVILDTLINYCSNKLAINRALQFSLGYIYNDYIERVNLTDDPERYSILIRIDDSLIRDITQSIAIVNQDIAVYSILFNRLSYVNATKNASSLYSLINELNSYKKQMKKRY